MSDQDRQLGSESDASFEDDVAIRSRLGVELPGGFRVRRFIGRGGMGAVFEARRRGDPRKYAIKFLHPELAGRASSVARFRREANILAALDNEHIVAVRDVGHADDAAPFIAMELLRGQSLRALLSRTVPVPTRRAVELAVQACRGLAAAHARGIVHRDLKPENLFVARRDDGTDWVKVLDFGIAKLLDGELVTSAETQSGALLGTLSYMAPEQVRGEPDLDGRVDVYAIGCILYEMLTGQRAHFGARPHEVLYHVLHRRPPPLRDARPDLPPELLEAVERATEKDLRVRTASIEALLQELEQIAAHQLGSHRDRAPVRSALGADDATLTDAPASAGASLSASQSSAGGSAVADVVGAQPVSNKSWWWPVLLVCALGFGVWAGRRGSSEAPAPPREAAVRSSPSVGGSVPNPAIASAAPRGAVDPPPPSVEPAAAERRPAPPSVRAETPRVLAKVPPPTASLVSPKAEAPVLELKPVPAASAPLQFERHNPYE